MTECLNAEMRDALPDLIAGREGDPAYAPVWAHVEECEACFAELRLLREVRSALTPRPSVDISRISERVVARTRRRRYGSPVFARLAAAAVLLAAGVEGARLVGRTGPEQAVRVADSVVASSSDDGGAVAVGAGFTDVPDADLDRFLAKIEQFDGLIATEPRAGAMAAVADGGTF